MKRKGYEVLSDLEQTLGLSKESVEGKGTLHYFTYSHGSYAGFLKDKNSGFEVLIKSGRDIGIEQAAILKRASETNEEITVRGKLEKLKLGAVASEKQKLIKVFGFRCKHYKTSGFDLHLNRD